MPKVRIEPMFTITGVDLSIPVKKWLIRGYGGFWVGQLRGSHLLLVEYSGQSCEFFAYADFDQFCLGETESGVDNAPPAALIRVLARELGITHVGKHDQPVDTFFPSDDLDPLRNRKYRPKRI